MSTYNLLDSSQGCNQPLPVNTLVDDIHIQTFIEIKAESNGQFVPVEVPVGHVMPEIVKTFTAVGTKKQKITEMLIGGPALNKKWQENTPLIPAPATKVVIRSLPGLLKSGQLQTEEGVMKVEFNSRAIQQLKAGFPVIVDAVQDTLHKKIEVEPNFKLANGNYHVELDESGFENLFKTGDVQVAGFGKKVVKIGASEIDQLLQTGRAGTQFSENAKAKLSISFAPEQAVKSSAPLLVNVAERSEYKSSITSSITSGPQLHLLPMPFTTYTYTPVKLPVEPKLPNFPLILYVPYQQRWTLQGYARGALLNTLSLAPQEEIIIELKTFERRKTEHENSNSTEDENTLELGLNNKESYEAVDETRRDNGWKLSVDGGFAIPTIGLNVNAGYELKDELTKSAKSVVQRVQESVQKSTSKIKSTRQTKVVETSESGSENKVTRRITNPNMGRTLNVDAFEVLSAYKVNTKPLLAEIRLCVLIQMPDFVAPILQRSLISLLTNQHILSPHIPAELKGGFEAAKKLEVNERFCTFKCQVPCTCETEGADATPKGTGSQTALQAAEAAMLAAGVTVVNSIRTLNTAGVATLGQIIADNFAGKRSPSDQWDKARQEVRMFLYRRLVLDGAASRFWSQAKGLAGNSNPTLAQCEHILSARNVSPLDVFNTGIQFGIMGVAKVTATLFEVLLSWPLVPGDMIPHLGFDDGGMEAALNQLSQANDRVKSEREKIAADEKAKADADGAKKQAIDVEKKDEPPFTPLELAQASVAYDALLAYISINAEFFRTLIWGSVSPDDRATILKLYGRMNEMLTGRVIGFSGSQAVYEFDLTKDDGAAAWFKKNITDNDLLSTQGSEIDVTLPTPGITLESRLGKCDALEPFLVDSRNAEIKRLNAVAAAVELENKRLDAKLTKGELDNPAGTGPLLRVELVNPTS